MSDQKKVDAIYESLQAFFGYGQDLSLNKGDLRALASQIKDALPEPEPGPCLSLQEQVFLFTKTYKPGPLVNKVDSARLLSENIKKEPGGFAINEETLRAIIYDHRSTYHRLDGLLSNFSSCRVCNRLDYKLRQAIKEKTGQDPESPPNPPCSCKGPKVFDSEEESTCLHRELALTVHCPEGAVIYSPRVSGQNYISQAIEWTVILLTADNDSDGARMEMEAGEHIRLQIDEMTHQALDELPEFEGF